MDKILFDKKSIFSSLTQRTTLKIIVNSLNNFVKVKDKEILELGGGNSCFFSRICRKVQIKTYDIIDNCKLAVELFNKKTELVSHKGILKNLLEDCEIGDKQYDFVFSIGLIEHFRNKDIDTLIKRHFEFCKDGGYVLISVPTPTRKYKKVRKAMEKLGVWQFWDEEPLKYAQIKDRIQKYGTIEKAFINKKIPLTQLVIIVKKKSLCL